MFGKTCKYLSLNSYEKDTIIPVAWGKRTTRSPVAIELDKLASITYHCLNRRQQADALTDQLSYVSGGVC